MLIKNECSLFPPFAEDIMQTITTDRCGYNTNSKQQTKCRYNTNNNQQAIGRYDTNSKQRKDLQNNQLL
jgi:hypothetical protein